MNILDRVLSSPRWLKRAILATSDGVAVVVAFYTAYALRLSEWFSPLFVEPLMKLSMPLALLAIVLLWQLGLYRAVARYLDVEAVWRIALAAMLLGLILAAMAFMLSIWMPRTIPVIFVLLAFVYLSGIRFVFRWWVQRSQYAGRGEPVAIYGAGEAGRQLVNALRLGKRFRPIAYIDDDAALLGAKVQGLPVWSPGQLARVHKHITRVFLALPSVTPARRRAILRDLERYPIRVQTMPSIDDIASGYARVGDIQDLSLDDLVEREPVPPIVPLLTKSVTDQVVLVTGAGGSIGSELCRVIVTLRPRRIVLLERNEYALYKIDQELAAIAPELERIPVLGSVTDLARVEQTILRFDCRTVYHAAAYKHVPLVEHNVIEGVRNNIVGTHIVLTACERCAVERLVLISTDKAVRPTNVMGATKRFAELLIQSRSALLSKKGVFLSIVRFGNVLGSSGSVVPRFHEQIEQGGPVTVTHPDMTRFFMSIREAAELVIQAGSMSAGGEIFLLDMGKPVSILNLAKRMIRLHGKVPACEDAERGVEIVFTGLRPGEKLFEELLIGSDAQPTQHPKIFLAREPCPEMGVVQDAFDQLQDLLKKQSAEEIYDALKRFVPGFSGEVCRDWFCEAPTRVCKA